MYRKYILNIGLFLLVTACLNTELQTIIYTGEIDEHDVTAFDAKIQGVIVSLKDPVSEFGHCWVEDSTKLPTLDDLKVFSTGLADKGGFFNSNLTGLFPNTTYALRGYAKVNDEVIYGKKITFRTKELQKAELTIISIADIKKDSATAMARINTRVRGNITKTGFCWKIAESFNQTDPDTTNFKMERIWNNRSEFQENIGKLKPNLTYLIRSYLIIEENNKKRILYSANKISFITPL